MQVINRLPLGAADAAAFSHDSLKDTIVLDRLRGASAVLFAGVALIPFLQIGAGIAIMSLSIAGRRRVNAPRRRSNFA